MPAEARSQSAKFRRTDLDWVRIGAFALLILFHVGVYYGPSDWEIKSPHILPWLAIPLGWSSPWRLLALFIVSGAATRFMARNIAGAGQLLRARSHRLLLPLLFGLFVVIPPQLYIQDVERYGYLGDYWQFWGSYLLMKPGLCHPATCPFLPDWKHLWFVGYLWVYTAALTAWLARDPDLAVRLEARLARHLAGWRLLVLPALYLIAVEVVLRHFFPQTDDFIHDWDRHADFVAAFLFGFTFAGSDKVWDGFARLRWAGLAAGIAAYATLAFGFWHYHNAPKPFIIGLGLHVLYGLDQWMWLVALFGFARRYLTHCDGAVRRYLTEAIFPYYIVHQTAIIIAAHMLLRVALPVPLEASILVVATVASCALTYEIGRRAAWLRPWIGLRPKPRPAGRPGSAPVTESRC